MNKFFKKINNKLINKKSQAFETDAAPSRPRSEEEISDQSGSSDDDEEFVSSGNYTKHKQPKPDDEEIPEFKKSEANTSSVGGQTYMQTNNIHISHSNGIQIGNQYHFNIQKSSGQKTNSTAEEVPSQPPKPQPPPPKIEKTFCNREPAQTTDFISIKFDIGSNWRGVAEQLGLSTGAIQQVYEKYKEKGISEVFYQLMLKWKESQPRATTTVGLLCEALWNSNETSAANTLSKLHPSK